MASTQLKNTTWKPKQQFKKWLFQLDDSQSLHKKWLFQQTYIYKWLFGVPGCQIWIISPSRDQNKKYFKPPPRPHSFLKPHTDSRLRSQTMIVLTTPLLSHRWSPTRPQALATRVVTCRSKRSNCWDWLCGSVNSHKRCR